MSSDLKREYIRLLWLRYQNANRRQKTIILNEFCQVSGLTRKYAIRRMRLVPTGFKRNPGRRRVYSEHAVFHLQKLWLLARSVKSAAVPGQASPVLGLVAEDRSAKVA